MENENDVFSTVAVCRLDIFDESGQFQMTYQIVGLENVLKYIHVKHRQSMVNMN